MDYQEIYNKAAYAAIKCSKDRVKANQINQLLSIFNSKAMENIKNTLMRLIAFVMRQTTRGFFKKESSEAIKSTLNSILNENIGDNVKKIKTRNFLGLLKWFFEVSTYEKKDKKGNIIDKIRVDWNVRENNSFNSIVKSFSQWARIKQRSRR